MMDADQETTLLALFDAAEKSCHRGTSTSDYEPNFVRLLEFIQNNPGLKARAEERFLEALSRKPLCHELIGFCMHTLRFESVLEEASRMISPSEPRGWGPLSEIVSSFEDSWADRDMYDYYAAQR